MKNHLLDQDLTWAPLCLDALTARIAESAGFTAGYVSGGALGYAHAVSEALLTTDELADVVRHVTARSGLSIIVDAGVGFGDPVHVTRAVNQFEAAGACAIEIEDQVAPKRVSHHRGIEHLVPLSEMVSKIDYAVKARQGKNFLIIARTGAVKNESFQQACERARAYHEAGADMILIMPDRQADWLSLADQVAAPIVTFGALGARSSEDWQALGVSLVVDPFTPQVLAVEAVRNAFDGFMKNGHVGRSSAEIFDTYSQLDTIAGFEDWYQIEDQTTEKPDSD